MLHSKTELRGKQVGVVVSGGNLDVTLLARIIERGLVRDGRRLRLRIHLPDYPGALEGLAATICCTGRFGSILRNRGSTAEASHRAILG